MVYTYHTYPDLITSGGRLARTDWEGVTVSNAVASTIKHDPSGIILGVRANNVWLTGHAPGGINA